MLVSKETATKKLTIIASTILIGLFVFAMANAELSEDGIVNVKLVNAQAGLSKLQSEMPNIKAYWRNDRITRLYGTAFSHGNSPLESAENFVQDHSKTLNAIPFELRQTSLLKNKSNIQQLMYNPETGEYKFSLVYYTQYRNDIPVYGSELRLLVRNEADYPVVLAISTLRELEDFTATDKSMVDYDFAQNAVKSDNAGLIEFNSMETVIWAGIEDRDESPKLAVSMVGTNDFPEVWRYVIDAETGEVLYKEDLIVFEDISGTISGMATEGLASEQCADEIITPLPYARVSNGTNITYTDVNGNYTLIDVGVDSITVNSEIYGQYFIVYNEQGTESVISRDVLPPETADFLHNGLNTEFERAQVNAYVQANMELDMVLSYNPSYPTLSTQSNFPIYVNRNDGYCPANAWYDPNDVSMNFCIASGSYPNTAWQSVLFHEFGHYMVDMAGSGQGQYGEGSGDIMSIIVSDDPRLGLGFYGSCTTPLRNADNTLQYPCTDEIHTCGGLLSACFWHTRNELILTEPKDYMDILANIFINSILLHTGTEITPQITIDFLTLDDDDADLGNGTPHYPEICAGFGAHNMDCPELSTIDFVYTTGRPEIIPPFTVNTFEVEVQEIGMAPVSGTGVLYYSINGGSYQTTSMTETSPNVYLVELPSASCNDIINWFVAAEADGFGTVFDPTDAPSTVFTTVVATGIDIIFEDDFETSTGWTVAGSVTDGPWERGVPAGGGLRGDPASDFDGSGSCYLTDNVEGNSDVDGGTTSLISPTFDLSGGNALIHYARWHSNNTGDNPNVEIMYIYISNDNGSNWILADSAGPSYQANGGWYEYSFWAEDIVSTTSQMRLKFDASDNIGAIVESGVDDVWVKSYVCASNQPTIQTASIDDWTISIPLSVQLTATGGTGNLTWTDKFNNLATIGLSLSTEGLVSGTPTIATDISFTARVEDESSEFDEELFSFTINSIPTITTSSPLTEWTVGQTYSESIAATGGTGALSWLDKNSDLTGTGLSMATNGNITGTALSDGTIGFTAQVTDIPGAATESYFEIVINPAVAITTSDLPDGREGDVYSSQLIGSGGTGDIDWLDKNSDLSGSGLTLSATGLLSGTPIEAGTIEFTAEVSDMTGSTGEQFLSVLINPAFICGDVDNNELLNILDVTYLIAYLYRSGPAPYIMESADVNNDTLVNILDVTALIAYLYQDPPELICP